MKIFRLLPVLLSISFASAVCEAAPPEIRGVPNFGQVNERLYRGGQPTDLAWPQLAALGVKTVVDLRRESEHSTTDEARAVQAAGMRYVSVPMNGFDTPRAERIAAVLALMDTSDVVFVHCKMGMDRTGTVVAAHRIAREGWKNERALEEAEAYGLHWWERGMKRFIAGYRPEAVATRTAGTAVGAVDASRAVSGVPDQAAESSAAER